MPEPTILVTGASGVVGSALLRELDGHPVIALTHHKPVATRSVRGDITKPWLGLRPREYRELAAAALAALARAETAGGEHWITAGETALLMTRVIELGCDIVGTRTRRQGSTRSIDPMMFQPRLVDPNVCDSVIDSVLGRTNSGAAPSAIRQAATLMAAYNDVDPFPTSLGRIPNGPPAPSIDALEQALRNTLGYLVDLPQDIWKLT